MLVQPVLTPLDGEGREGHLIATNKQEDQLLNLHRTFNHSS